jgi:hypothetical protein
LRNVEVSKKVTWIKLLQLQLAIHLIKPSQKSLHSQENQSKQFSNKRIEQYRRQQFLAAANQAYLALRDRPEAWQEELEEREAWDITLEDGLEQKC